MTVSRVSRQNEWEFGRRYNEVDSVRVSVYARSATMPGELAESRTGNR